MKITADNGDIGANLLDEFLPSRIDSSLINERYYAFFHNGFEFEGLISSGAAYETGGNYDLCFMSNTKTSLSMKYMVFPKSRVIDIGHELG